MSENNSVLDLACSVCKLKVASYGYSIAENIKLGKDGVPVKVGEVVICDDCAPKLSQEDVQSLFD
tara:strand:- start:2242 stop:2436 length:195 start_codon:yes stop_codon:yes gene_type:complete